MIAHPATTAHSTEHVEKGLFVFSTSSLFKAASDADASAYSFGAVALCRWVLVAGLFFVLQACQAVEKRVDSAHADAVAAQEGVRLMAEGTIESSEANAATARRLELEVARSRFESLIRADFVRADSRPADAAAVMRLHDSVYGDLSTRLDKHDQTRRAQANLLLLHETAMATAQVLGFVGDIQDLVRRVSERVRAIRATASPGLAP